MSSLLPALLGTLFSCALNPRYSPTGNPGTASPDRCPTTLGEEATAWFAEFDAARWDRQIEEDVAAGRLDALAEEALNDLRQGRCTDR
jgi:hypothetical protein